jgi:sigma54-dependent transcription regulator
MGDIRAVSPETEVRLHELALEDPWDFEQRRTTSNDADRLRKYLARFGLTWVGLVERRAGD